MSDSIYKPKPDCQIAGIDRLYDYAFGRKTDGVFVEIGAYDGVSWSNTCFLADLGWHGLYIEPVMEFYHRCQFNHKDHHNVRVLNVGCSSHDGYAMMTTDRVDLYTIDPILAGVLNAKHTHGLVPVYTLDHILYSQFTPPQEQIDLLVIDVEGAELKVLEGFTLSVWLPKMVIIEAHEHHPNEALRGNAAIIDAFFANGYIKVHSDAINNVYVRMR